MVVTAAEFLWRSWVLGEGIYKGEGPRSTPRPNVGYGDPNRGQKPVPRTWWARLEAFLARRDDHAETPGPQLSKPKPKKPAPTEQLSPHFNVREFDCRDGRQVPKVAVPALIRLAALILEPLRTQFGPCTVLSGYRPADYNRRIGGARFSQHVYELTPDSVAADVIFATGRPADWYREANRLGAGGLGRYETFLHIDNRPTRARWAG